MSNRAVVLQLTNPVPAGVLAYPSTALLNIVSDGYNLPPGGGDPNFFPAFNGVVNAVGLQSNGAIVVGGAFTVANSITRNRLARLNPDGSLDMGFASLPGGANDAVRALALQSDGRIIIGGDFTTYDGINRSHFARVNLDGTLDWQFDPGSALDHSPYAVVETFTDTNRTVRKILVGGSFTLANGAPRRYLAQFNDNGSPDLDFNPDNGAGGIDDSVWAIAVQTDRKIVIGGDFVSINGVARNHIARLNADGSLDTSFNNPGTGASDSVRALTIQLDGRILVGGLFTNFNGTVQNHIVRLNADGSLDPTFNGGVGADGAVYAIALQPDTRILLGGEFTRYGGVTRNRLTRLNPDGSVDPTINFGAGCDSYVASLAVQTNDAIVLGGGFTTYDEAPALYLTRVFGLSIAGSGTFEFTSATFGADETATNAVVTVRRRGGTSATTSGPNVFVTVATSDGPPPNGAINGINYLGGVFTNTFPPGETLQSLLIPVMRDFQVTPDLTVNLQLTDIQPLGLAGLGNQPIRHALHHQRGQRRAFLVGDLLDRQERPGRPGHHTHLPLRQHRWYRFGGLHDHHQRHRQALRPLRSGDQYYLLRPGSDGPERLHSDPQRHSGAGRPDGDDGAGQPDQHPPDHARGRDADDHRNQHGRRHPRIQCAELCGQREGH